MPDQVATTCHVCGSARRQGTRFCGTCGSPYEANGALAPTVAMSANAWDMASTSAVATAPPRPRYAEVLGLIGLAALGIPFLILWFVAINEDVPGYPNVLDFKISLATFVGIMAIVQGLSAAVFYGWLKTPWPSADAAAFMHRWSGRIIIPAALIVTVYCVRDIGPQTSPTRAAVHTVLGSMVFVVLAAKLIILRFIPRLGSLLPVLGLAVMAAFIGLWFTSSFAVLRTTRGYSTSNVGASVGIITDPQTIGRYDPLQVKVKVGQSVVWINRDNAPHTITDDGGKFDSGIMAAGTGYSWEAKTAGTFKYKCAIHPQMALGTIVVEE
jgi:plastocyanin